MTDDLKCICGRTFDSKVYRGAHYKYCKQWHDYLDMMAADPQVKEKLGRRRYGNKKLLADELGVSEWTLDRLLRGTPVKEQPKAGSEMMVELTPHQVIQAVRLALEEHAIATKAAAELKAALEAAEERLTRLSAELAARDAELNRMRARELEPIKFRLEREAIEHQREAH